MRTRVEHMREQGRSSDLAVATGGSVAGSCGAARRAASHRRGASAGRATSLAGAVYVGPNGTAGEFLINGTRLPVDDLVQIVKEGRRDHELRQLHPELSPADVDAARHHARAQKARGGRSAAGLTTLKSCFDS